MEGNFFKKLKNKFEKDKNNYPHINEFSFSGDELEDLSRKNKEEIDKLRNGYVKKVVIKEEKESSLEEDIKDNLDNNINEGIISSDKEIVIDDVDNVSSYINLSDDRRENIMKRWNSIDIIRLSKDIDEGKDILEHNYVITYADDALSYIYKIRDEYDILIEYLIGFNNEKRGVMNKNIFSSRLDDEWKFLNSYIKVLEKIKDAIDK
ncbi:MAG: hypothetical protein IJI49_03455 [Bacilli bacterium]|nr:hypothetical protein [Bacilli bacterium]